MKSAEVGNLKPYELTRAFYLGLRVLGRRYSHREVEVRLKNHPQSGSLLAVADLASTFGVRVTAVRCDPGDIDPESVPLLLQLHGGGTLGFATVDAVTADGFSILDSKGEPCFVSRLELDWLASGVTVFLEMLVESGQAERGYLLHRLTELPADLGDRLLRYFPAFSGIGSGMRIITLALLAISIILGFGNSLKIGAGQPSTILVAVAVVGLVLSCVLFAFSRSEATHRSLLSQRLCASDGLLDCESVLHSRWASVGPWTLASLGVAWFLSLLATFGWVGVLIHNDRVGLLWLAFSLLLSTPIALLLVLVQIWPLKKVCPLCMTLHLAVFAGAAAGWQFLGPELPPWPLRLAALWPIGLLHVWLFSLVLGVLMPWIKNSAELDNLADDLASATATPLGSLALLLAKPPLQKTASSALMRWGNAQAPLIVDGFVNPICSACGPVLSDLLELARRREDRICVVIHLVEKRGLHPGRDRSLLLAVLAIAAARGSDAAADAFWTIKRSPEEWLANAVSGATEVGARLAGCSTGEIEEALPLAHEALDRASTLAQQARGGLPFLLVAGRKLPAPVQHLDVLVGSHHTLLLDALEISPASARVVGPEPPPDLLESR